MAKENKPKKKPTRSERKALRARQEESRRITQESAPKTEKKEKEKVAKQPGPAGEYLRGVRQELRAVTWPSSKERRNASVAVFAALIFFGVLIYALDTGIVPLLNWYVSL